MMSDFKVEVRKDRYTGHAVSITNNGHQWTTLTIRELSHLKQLSESIDKYLTDNNHPNHGLI